MAYEIISISGLMLKNEGCSTWDAGGASCFLGESPNFKFLWKVILNFCHSKEERVRLHTSFAIIGVCLVS